MTRNDIDLPCIAQKSAEVATLLKLLSNEHRLLILCNLADNELCVSDLEQRLNISQSSLSQHLARLRSQGVVEFRKESTTVYYTLSNPKAASLIKTIHSLYCKDVA